MRPMLLPRAGPEFIGANSAQKSKYTDNIFLTHRAFPGQGTPSKVTDFRIPSKRIT